MDAAAYLSLLRMLLLPILLNVHLFLLLLPELRQVLLHAVLVLQDRDVTRKLVKELEKSKWVRLKCLNMNSLN